MRASVKRFTKADYEALDRLVQRERGREKRVTKAYIRHLKKGKLSPAG